MKDKGTLTLSIEVELAWGLHHRGEKSPFSKDRETETRTLERIIELSERYDIPISFDFVGHLLLEGCDGKHYHGHQDGWFDRDPGTDHIEDPLYYAPDLVEKVLNSAMEHEISTHSFSHIWVDEVADEVLSWELKKVRSLHDDLDIQPPVSFVPPQQRDVRDYEVLKKNGIKVIRKTPGEFKTESKLKMLSNDLSIRCPIEEPREKEGILESYTSHRSPLTSLFLPAGQKRPHPLLRTPLPSSYWVKRHRKRLISRLEETVDRNSYLHLWSHLWELSNPSQLKILEGFMRDIDDKIRDDRVDVKTMKRLL